MRRVRHRPGCDGPTATRVAVNLDYGIEFCTICGAVRTMTGHEARAARLALSDGRNADRSMVGGTDDDDGDAA